MGLRLTTPAAIACLALAWAQSIPPDEIHSKTVPYVPPPQFTLRTEVRTVEVPVVVRDAQHQTVAGLTRDDFRLFDDGKPQAITAFSVAGAGQRSNKQPRPRFLALCFDDLHLSAATLKAAKEAAERFVRTGLLPTDRVAVIPTSRSQESGFTDQVPALIDQIEKLAPAPRLGADESRCPLIRPYEALQIANSLDPGHQVLQAKMAECEACYHNPCPETEITGKANAIWANLRSASTNTLKVVDGIVEGMAKLPGQRLILLTSSGFLAGTLEANLDRLMDKARHAEVVISDLDAGGLYANLSGSGSYEGASALASGTGGAIYQNNNDLERGFRDLGVIPETIYQLSFAPPRASDGRFHKLKVQLAEGRRYSLEARLGYTATAPDGAGPDVPASRLDREVMASDALTELPASFTWEQWAGPPGITMVVHLDIGRLNFQPWQGRRTQQLTLIAVLREENGSFVAGKRSELQLSFRDATFARFAKSGFTTALTISAPPGRYSVRAVAEEAMESKLAAASAAVEIK